MTSSLIRPPLSMMAATSRPSGVPAWTASRSIAPVEMCGIFHFLRSWRACVPLPAPGGPSITKLSSIQLSTGESQQLYECRPRRVDRDSAGRDDGAPGCDVGGTLPGKLYIREHGNRED